MENLEPPSPSKSRMGKWRVLALRAASSLIWGDGGLLFHFILSQIAIVDKVNGKTRPPLPPNSRMEKWRLFALRAASSLTWEGRGFAVPFYFVQDRRSSWQWIRAYALRHSAAMTHVLLYYIINSKRRRKRHKYVTNQRNVKNLAERYETVGLFGVSVTWKNNQCLWNW